MSTLLSLTNEVLKKLREDAVTATSNTSYATLVASLVNDAKREVEDAWNWTDLREAITVNCVASQNFVAVTGTNPRTKILRVDNLTEDYELAKIDHTQYEHYVNIGSTTNNSPMYYRVRGVNNTGLKLVELYPTPDSTDQLSFYVKNPQTDLATDATELTLQGVDHVIVWKAWALAISERGEDGGQLFDEVTRKADMYLSESIMLDKVNTVGEGDWEVY